MDFIALREKRRSIAVIARSLGLKPLLAIPQCITSSVCSFHTMHIYVALRCVIYGCDAAKSQVKDYQKLET